MELGVCEVEGVPLVKDKGGGSREGQGCWNGTCERRGRRKQNQGESASDYGAHLTEDLANTAGVPEQRLPGLGVNGQAATSLSPPCSMSGSA